MELFYSNGHMSHSKALHSFAVDNGDITGDNLSHHEGWEIIFGGTLQHKGIEMDVGGRRYDMSKTPCLIYNGHEEHHEYFQQENLKLKALVIRDDTINSYLDGLANAEDFSFKCEPVGQSMILKFADSIHTLLRTNILDPLEVEAVTGTLLYEFLDQPHNLSSVKVQLAGTSLNQMLFKDIMIYLHAHALTANFDLNHMSQHLGVSKFHIVRTTKKRGGFTPHAYVLKIRLEEAKRLLTDTQMTIGAIAFKCGFDDLSTFNKAFKRRFNVAPSAYRPA